MVMSIHFLRTLISLFLQIDQICLDMLDPDCGVTLGKRKNGLIETIDNAFSGENVPDVHFI